VSPLIHSHESHLRSILKAFSWRIIATCTTAAIAYIVTGNIKVALVIGGAEFMVKIAAYYIHERAWQIVPPGTIRKLYQVRELFRKKYSFK
jgi:uncharacterized membrane protein